MSVIFRASAMGRIEERFARMITENLCFGYRARTLRYPPRLPEWATTSTPR